MPSYDVNATVTLAATGAELIAAERQRQIDAEGWSQKHDDDHDQGEMADAAACYALGSPDFWPWEWKWWKQSGDRKRDLVKAGALIAAEIDRLQRRPER